MKNLLGIIAVSTAMLVIIVTGCDSGGSGAAGEACEKASDCAEGLACVGGICQAGGDGGQTGTDAGDRPDAAADAGTPADAGHDDVYDSGAVVDASDDAGVDASADGGTDGGPDGSQGVPGVPLILTLNTDAPAVATGAAITLTWETANAVTAPGTELIIRAREPGPSSTPLWMKEVIAGVLLPGTTIYHLQPDGKWSREVAVFSPSINGGSVTFTLPTVAEGVWGFDAIVRSAGGERVAAWASAEVLVSGAPAIRLKVDKLFASTADPVHVELVTAAGTTPRPVTIVASMLLPDGTTVFLPGEIGAVTTLHDGDSVNSRVTLFRRQLALADPEDTPKYIVTVNLLDRATGAPLGHAEAGFTVCDYINKLRGTVVDGSGAPLDGATALLAEVRALDLDRKRVEAATIGADGTYTIQLAPGRYHVSATVWDDKGRHEARTGEVFLKQCGRDDTLDLAAAPPVPVSAFAKRLLGAIPPPAAPRPVPPGTPLASDGLPKPAVFMTADLGFSSEEHRAEADLIAETIFTRMSTAERDIAFRWNSLVRSLAELNEWILNLGGSALLEGILAATGPTEATIMLAFDDRPSKPNMMATLDHVPSHRTLHAGLLILDPWPAVDAVLPFAAEFVAHVSDQINGTTVQGMFNVLRALQDRPIEPYLDIALNATDVPVGGAVNVTFTLLDMNGDRVRDKQVGVEYGINGGVPMRANGVTDTLGHVTVSMPTTAAGVYWVKGSFSRGGNVWPSRQLSYRVQDIGDLQLIPDKVILLPGERISVQVVAKQTGTPTAGRTVTLAATMGTVSPASVVTDASGEEWVDYTAPQNGGVDRVTASMTAGTPPQTVTAAVDLIIGYNASLSLTVQPSSVPAGATASLTAQVIYGPLSPQGVPVRFVVTNGGAVSPEIVTTDVHGQARATYLSPPIGCGQATITALATIGSRGLLASKDVQYTTSPCSDTQPLVPDVSGFYTGTIVREIGAACGQPGTDTLPARATIDQSSATASVITDLYRRDGGTAGEIWEFHAFNAGPGYFQGTVADPIASLGGSQSSWGEHYATGAPVWQDQNATNEWQVSVSVDETFHLTGQVTAQPFYMTGPCHIYHLDLVRQ